MARGWGHAVKLPRLKKGRLQPCRSKCSEEWVSSGYEGFQMAMQWLYCQRYFVGRFVCKCGELLFPLYSHNVRCVLAIRSNLSKGGSGLQQVCPCVLFCLSYLWTHLSQGGNVWCGDSEVPLLFFADDAVLLVCGCKSGFRPQKRALLRGGTAQSQVDQVTWDLIHEGHCL